MGYSTAIADIEPDTPLTQSGGQEQVPANMETSPQKVLFPRARPDVRAGGIWSLQLLKAHRVYVHPPPNLSNDASQRAALNVQWAVAVAPWWLKQKTWCLGLYRRHHVTNTVAHCLPC